MAQTLTLVEERRRILVRSARPRRFGSLFIPLRRAYLFIMPMILIFGAMICYSFGTDLALIIGAVDLAAISLYLVFDLLGRRAPLRVSTVLAFTLGLGYGLGTANTWFTLPRGPETLGEFLHISTQQLAYGMGSVLLAVALLLSVGEIFERPIFGEDFELRFSNRSIVFLTIGGAVLAGSFAKGATSFMGATDSGVGIGHVGILASLASWLSGSLLALSVCVSLNIKSGFLKLYTRVLSILLFLLVLPLGRRVMIYAVVLVLIGLRLGRYRIPYSPLKKTLLLGLLGLVMYFATIGFFFLRVAGYGMLRPTLYQRVDAAIRLFRDKNYADIKRQFTQNIQTRTFILGFLAELEGYTETMQGGHGEDLLELFQLSLPSILFPQKNLFFSEEGLADSLFGAYYTDEANSVLTAGAVDFGLWGVLVYPLLFVLILRAFFELLAETLPVFVSCFIILASFSALLEPEITLTAYFLILRNGLFFGFLVWFIMSLPEFRVKNVGL